MSSYFFLIPISLLLAVIALLAFVWSLRHGQYDDMKGAAHRILAEEDAPVAGVGPRSASVVTAGQARSLRPQSAHDASEQPFSGKAENG